MSLIVSLSTIPTRFNNLGPVLENIGQQTADIDEIRLYIPKRFRRFPDYDGGVPDVPKNVRIIRPDDDLGPASKVLFAADDLKGTDCDIIYCDDDMLFEPSRFERMIAERGPHKDRCVTPEEFFIVQNNHRIAMARRPVAERYPKNMKYRMQRIQQIMRGLWTGQEEERPLRRYNPKPGFTQIAQGFAAVLVRPEFFDPLFYDIPPVLWTVDDTWLSGHLERMGVPIWAGTHFELPRDTAGTVVSALNQAVIDGANRQEADNACVKYMQDTYGIWR